MKHKRLFLLFLLKFFALFLVFLVYLNIFSEQVSFFDSVISAFACGSVVMWIAGLIFDDICSCIKFWKENRNSPPSGEDKK